MTILDASGRDPEADDFAMMVVAWLSDKRVVQTIVKRRKATMQDLFVLHGLLCEHIQRKGKPLLTPDQIRRDMLMILEDRTIRMSVARKVAIDELEEYERDGADAWEEIHPGMDPADSRRIRDTLQTWRTQLEETLNSLILRP